MAFPDGIIYNAANIPARLNLQDRLPPLLAEKLSGDKMVSKSNVSEANAYRRSQAPVTSEPSTPHAQFGSQYTGSERAVVTGPSGESMYPGVSIFQLRLFLLQLIVFGRLHSGQVLHKKYNLVLPSQVSLQQVIGLYDTEIISLQ
jgi:hypothetical protein